LAQATSAGVKDQEAVNYLEKKYRGGAAVEHSFEETVQLAIAALQVRRCCVIGSGSGSGST